MAKSDRLFRLLDQLRKGRAPHRAEDLARALEVSQRTIYRDIEAIRAAGALIDGEAGVGYVLIEDQALPPQMFSRIEIEALTLALSELRFSGDEELATASISAFGKIVATLPSSKQREALHAAHYAFRFEDGHALPAHMKLVREAIWQERAIATDYEDKSGQMSHRKLWPLAVAFWNGNPMLLAYCHLREDFRNFHLGKMNNVRCLDENFRPRRVALLREMHTKLRAEHCEKLGDVFIPSTSLVDDKVPS